MNITEKMKKFIKLILKIIIELKYINSFIHKRSYNYMKIKQKNF